MSQLVTWVARLVAALGCTAVCGCAPDTAADRALPAAPLDAVRALPAPPRRAAPRLSLVQQYRTCPPDADAPLGKPGRCAAAATAAPRALAVAVAAARACTDARVDADALHALALADLAWSDPTGKALDRSISTLRTVARLSARPAPALTDLAAALLVRADGHGEARDLFEAADVALLALESDSTLAPARFNLALALGRMGLVEESARAWAAFLAVEPGGPWADEARRRAAAVAASGVPPTFDPQAGDLAAEVTRSPQEARLYGWNEALGRWGAAVLAGDSAAARRELGWARVAGRALEARGGDATLADAVGVIEAAPTATRARALAAAHRAFAEGARHYAATRYDDAATNFAAAAGAPGALGLWGRAFLAGTYMYAGNRSHAERVLRAALAAADAKRHAAFLGRAGWILSTTLMRAGRTEEAYAQARAATAAFAWAGEREYLGAAQCVLAQAAYVLGDSRATLTAARGALTTLKPYRESLWLHTALFLAATGADRDGLLRGALRVQDEGVTVAARTGRPAYLAEARLVRARLGGARATAASRRRAADDVRAAGADAVRLLPGPTREWITADLRVAQALLAPVGDARHAIAGLDSVVTYFERPPVPMRLLPALVARADLHVNAGDTQRAGRDLDRALMLLAAAQQQTREMPLRTSLVATARAVTDRAMMLQLARGQVTDALVRLERGTAGLMSGRQRDASGVAAGAAPARLPTREVGLVYALVGDTLLTWVLDRSGTHLARSVVPRAALAGAIERARTALERNTTEAALGDLARLNDWLVRPVQRFVAPGMPVVIVDGESLGAVPWPALFDRQRGRYLVEDHVLRGAATLAAAGRVEHGGATPGRAGGAGSGVGSVLVVADPAPDPRVRPTLAPLDGAAVEVRELAARYASARVLAGPSATLAALRDALPRARLVHYAGHAVFDDERPERSALVLAPERVAPSATDGLAAAGLTAQDIVGLDLRRVRLVVLAACETVRSPAGRAGGFAGLAGAFVTAGAGGVVGASWRVDDRATVALMRAFHGAYARTGEAAGALRAAQLELLRSADPALRSPAAWAGFRYLGG